MWEPALFMVSGMEWNAYLAHQHLCIQHRKINKNSQLIETLGKMEKDLIERLESAVTRLEAITSGSGASADGTDASIAAFEDMISQFVAKVSDPAEKIGGQVLQVTKIVEEAFSVQKQLLLKIKQTKKPDIQGLAEFLKPLNVVISKSNTLTEGKRSDYFNHLKTAADSLAALAWIAYTGKDCGMSLPIAHVEESWQMAEFYSNKVLVEYKNKDPTDVEWVKAMKELYLLGLRDYVKNFYPLGPVWCPSGMSVPTSTPSKSISAPTGPAPPPPPPASLVTAESSGSSSSRGKEGMAAVFQELNTGSVTSGLRKVTDDMKTKNRKDRSGMVGTAEKEVRSSATSSKVGPSKFELQMGCKWVVEYQHGRKDLVIDNCDAKQSVYAFGCKDSVLQIQGKVNNITLDKCSKMGIVFTDVVAACELVNCNSVEVQCQGSAPTISVDNTSGCQLFLSKDSLETSITTAKSCEINVLVPDSGPDGDWAEHALPQQYVHVFKDGQFVTTPVSHSGA